MKHSKTYNRMKPKIDYRKLPEKFYELNIHYDGWYYQCIVPKELKENKEFEKSCIKRLKQLIDE